jgi:hypothetical protein
MSLNLNRTSITKDGAADQIRTGDLLHGKQTLYQLSYNRMKRVLQS